MRSIKGLIPARFLVMIAHLVIIITMFWSLTPNVQACLPVPYTAEEFNNAETFLIVLLSITLGLFCVELGGFMSGVSMFNVSQSLLSVAAHAGACVALSFFLFDEYACSDYWSYSGSAVLYQQ